MAGESFDRDVMPEVYERTVTDGDLTIRLEVVDTHMSMKLTGRVDSLTAPTFLQTWEEESAAHDIRSIEIDCSNLVFLSSAGLRVLVMMDHALPEGVVTLHNVHKSVYDVLAMTGLNDVLDIHLA